MTDLFEQGIESFNSARWFEAHEHWEDLWRETGSESRLFCQGLVQAAVGLHHLSNGNRRGARRVIERAIGNLAGYPRHYQGIDLDRLRAELGRVFEDAAPQAVLIHRAGEK
jgi:hypothetical protein